GHLRWRSRERLKGLGFEPHHTRRLHCTKADEERRVEHDGNLPKHFARPANTDHALRAVDDLRHFHEAFQQHEQDTTRVTLVDHVLTREQPKVSARLHQMVVLLVRELGEKRNGAQFVAGEHRRSLSPDSKSRRLRWRTLASSCPRPCAAECSPLPPRSATLVRMNRGRRAGRQNAAYLSFPLNPDELMVSPQSMFEDPKLTSDPPS